MNASRYHIVDGTAPHGPDLGAFHFFGIDVEFGNVDGDSTIVGERLVSETAEALTGYGTRHVHDPDGRIKMTVIRLQYQFFQEKLGTDFQLLPIVHVVC